MGAPSAHYAVCASVSERYVRCFVLFSFLLCRFVSESCFHTPSLPFLLRRQFFLFLHLTLRLLLLQLHSILFPQFSSHFLFFCFLTSTQCCRPYRLVESGLPTCCPCQLKTGPASSKQIQMSIVFTPMFTTNLIIVPSRAFRMCDFFSPSTRALRARTTFSIEI